MHLRHDWAEVGREFNAPPRLRMECYSQAAIERALHGFTQVEYACRREGCTKRKVVEYLGRLPDSKYGNRERER